MCKSVEEFVSRDMTHQPRRFCRMIILIRANVNSCKQGHFSVNCDWSHSTELFEMCFIIYFKNTFHRIMHICDIRETFHKQRFEWNTFVFNENWCNSQNCTSLYLITWTFKHIIQHSFDFSYINNKNKQINPAFSIGKAQNVTQRRPHNCWVLSRTDPTNHTKTRLPFSRKTSNLNHQNGTLLKRPRSMGP